MQEPVPAGPSPAGTYEDQPSRSPWVAQLAPDGPPRPLDADAATDVAIVGAGIAGVATAFFTLRQTDRRVLLIERDRVGRGATGHNAGQLTTYFERPLYDIAGEFGADMAIEGQRAFDDAHDLLDTMAAEAGVSVRLERFTGHMGMFALNHSRCTCATTCCDGRVACGWRRARCPRTPSSWIGSRLTSPACTRRQPGTHRRPARDRRGPLSGRAVRPQGLHQQRRAGPAGPRLPRAAIRGPVPVRRPDVRGSHRGRQRSGQQSTLAATR